MGNNFIKNKEFKFKNEGLKLNPELRPDLNGALFNWWLSLLWQLSLPKLSHQLKKREWKAEKVAQKIIL